MTVVETPLRVQVGWDDSAPRSRSAPWRMASRLARREVRRRPGRTVLVAVLVALPVLAMAVGVISARSTVPVGDETFTAEAGPVADLLLPRGPGDLPDARLEELLPAGARWSRYGAATGTVLTAGSTPRTAFTSILDPDVADPLTEGMVVVTSGRAPRDGEVAVTDDVARALRVEVGDTLSLARPDLRGEVVGIVRWPVDAGRSGILAPGFAWESLLRSSVTENVVVDLPGTPGPVAADEVLGRLQGGSARSVELARSREVPTVGLAWGWVAGALGLVAVGIVITAAFSTSARRQLVTVGQLSAQGASPRLVRWTLALQGSWSGLLGSLLGVAGAIVAVRVGFPLLEAVEGRDLPGMDVRLGDMLVVMASGIVAATVAALLPARSAARIPTLAALSGRRPVGTVPRRLVPVGLALFGGGLFLLAVAASASVRSGETVRSGDDLLMATAVLGGLGVMFGACCASPLAVTAAARAGGRLPGSWRLAARSMGRLRTRSAAVVTAIGVTGAVALALSTVVVTEVGAAETRRGDAALYSLPALPDDTLIVRVEAWKADGSPVDPATRDIPDGLRARLRDLFPDATFHARREAVGAGGAVTPDGAPRLIVADAATLDALGLSAHDRAALRDTGALVVDTAYVRPEVVGDAGTGEAGVAPTGPVEIPVVGADGPGVVEAAMRRDLPATQGGEVPALITEERARQAGLELVEAGALVRTGREIDTDDQGALVELASSVGQATGFPTAADATVAATNVDMWVDWEWIDTAPDITPAMVQGMIVLVALVLTLVVVAMGLGLSAVEGRDDRDVLIAVGAKPVTLRRMAGVRAVVLTATGALLAVPTGLLPAAVVLTAASDASLRLPWVAIGALLLVVPPLAGAAAWATSAVIQRVRPPRASTLAVD